MKKLRTLLVICAGGAMISSASQCFAQNAEPESNEKEVRRVEIRLQTEGTEIVSPELHGGRLAPNEGHPRVGLSFTGPPPVGAPNFGPPDFGPPGMRMRGPAVMHPGLGPQIHQPEAHGPDGPFAEDRRRIAALTESAERIARAGLPDVAHGLRERAGQLERELAEKQERMQQEERKRNESAMRERQEQARQQTPPHQPQRLMEQRREGFEIEPGDHRTPPLRELHGQMEQLRRDIHKLSEQMADLTRLIHQHHNAPKDRAHHKDMDDDEDGDDEDGDDEDGDDEDDEMDDRKERGEHDEE